MSGAALGEAGARGAAAEGAAVDAATGRAPGRGAHRHNNFDALRLFAAMIVVYGHGWGMTTSTSPGWWGNGPIARLGLDIFFSISGYLVTRSWDATPELAAFAAKRFLRLMPGLAACVLLTTFVLGPLLTTLPVGQYLRHGQTWTYLWNVALHLQLFLPGVFTHLREGGAVNGSLWSLCPEVLCYGTVAVLGGLGIRRRRAVLIVGGSAAGMAAVWLFQGAHAPVVFFYSMLASYALQEVPYFFAGAWLSLMDRNRPGFYRADVALGLFAAGWGLSALYGWKVMPIDWIAIPYAVIGFGRMSLPVVNRAGALGDLSYGTYLYAFPTQQALLLLWPRAAHPVLLCALVTLLVAFVSWHLVEKPGLAARERLGGAIAAGAAALLRVDEWVARGGGWIDGLVRAAPRLVPTPILPLLIAAAILLAYLAQLPLGRWQTDEYQLLANQREWGWHILPVRLSYSPRPFSEILLFLYGAVVLRWHAPLVAPFLGALWLGVLAATASSAYAALPRGRWRLPVALALAAAPFAFALVTVPVTELFFWPAAAAAYLPTAAAPLCLLFLLAGPPGGTRREIGCGLALLIGALSSEMGAAMALGFAAAAAVEAATRPGGACGGTARTLWWLLPGLAGMAVLAQIGRARVHIQELDSARRTLTGHPVAAGAAALVQAGRDLLGLPGMEGFASILPALALKLLFAAGLVGTWRWAMPAGGRLGRFAPVLGCGILAATLFSLWGALLHYGELCCERHESTRSWLGDVLAAIAMGWLLPRRWPDSRWLAPTLLTVSLVPLFWRLGGIRADLDTMHLAREGRAKTWSSAGEGGSGPLLFFLPPDGAGLLVRGTAVPLGRVRVDPDGRRMTDAAGRLFRRDSVEVCQPWQEKQSWLYYGHFLPACPPHGGPPDRIFPVPAGTARH